MDRQKPVDKASPTNRSTEKWQRQLGSRLPLVGGWLRIEAARLLGQAAAQGNAQAARILAMAMVSIKDEQVTRLAEETLSSLTTGGCIDAIWTAWIDTRSPRLLQLLLKRNWVATAPPKARVVSALRLQQPELVVRGGNEVIRPLIESLDDPNLEIREQANYCLRNLECKEAIEGLWSYWLSHRSQNLTNVLKTVDYPVGEPPAGVYQALLKEDTPLLRDAPPDWIPTLLDACQDSDAHLRGVSRRAAGELQNPASIDALCSAWAANRQTWLGKTIRLRHFLPRSAGKSRVICALKIPAPEIFPDLQAGEVPFLLAAREDKDPEIAGQVETAANQLARPEAVDAICMVAAEQEDPLAIKVSLENGFMPGQPQARALFFFMTEQWDRYQELDFDQRLLRSTFETADQQLRSRITRKLQRSGRLDYLGILAGNDPGRSKSLEDGEIEVLIQLLVDHQSWDRLWSLVFDLPAFRSIQAVRLLVENQWRPQDPSENQVFDRLTETLDGFTVPALEETQRKFPPQKPRTHLHVSGRINDVAFDPVNPVIAIATGSRKVVLWDFQQARIQTIISGFDHSVGRVAYTKNGFLVCAERSNTAVLCGVYLWEDERLRQIGQHQASVTALEGVGDQRLISTGKDNQAILWEIPSGRIITQKNLNFWPRAARVSPDGSQAVLLDQGLAVINLPEMDFLGGASRANQPGNGYDHSGVSRCAVFLPQPGQLALGKSNGRVVLYSRTGMNYRPDRFPLYKLDAEVQGLEFLPEHSLLVTATSRGQILYTAWPSREQIATPRHLGERLTSLCFSQSGDFLATGDSDASMALWDLRALDFPELVRSHFSKFSTRQQEIVHSLVDSTEIPPDLVRLARFMDLAIRFRNRFDIQISDAPAMKAGEFDILVD